LQVANREDPVLVANLGVTMGDVSSLLLLCLPFASLEKFFTGTTARRPEATQGSDEERTRNRSTIEDTVRTSKIPVGVRLPEFRVGLDRLADLTPGTILPTGLPTTTGLDLFVAGQRRFVGSAGRLGRNLAIRVQDAVEPEPQNLIEAGRQTPWATT
jgi:flagellar motor switch protein FliM